MRRWRLDLDPTALAFGAASLTLVLHLAVAGRYGFFRDELYFIACGRHPAFGYVDQPPLVPLIAAATQLFGADLFLLRAVAAMAAAGTVLVACALVRLAGGGPFAIVLAGLAVATCPMFVGSDGTLNTSAFEPLAWTLLAYFLARAALRDDRLGLLWAGIVIGVALEIKYQIPFYIGPLVLALLFTPERRLLFTRQAWIGALTAAAIAAPSIIWQALHGFPFVELLHNGASGKNEVYSPLVFVLQQVKVMNPLFAPIWIAGLVAALVGKRFVRLRFLGIAFALTFALMLALHAKDYYLAGLYAPMFALGAIVVESAVRSQALRAAYAVAGVILAALSWPIALPILDPPQLVRYESALHLRPDVEEASNRGQAIPQNLADQLGWRELERAVAAVYRSLPLDERKRAAIIASNYGEAGALDFYGPADGLPPALSGHNNYYLWGTHGYDGSVIVRVNSSDVSFWKQHCHSLRIAARFGDSPYVEPYERARPILVCRGFYRPLAADWPEFKFYY